ncbi:DotI/IcmL/TraM family protein [Vibrio parahaemolyticus]|uniref:DotI/IcmL/TraM family protein n=1 Tax=Vibrio parahaemolyticus TaxID=670 RepID=UPI00081343ED|nr:DotI/IcmL/TraM family protein [Vibrio parahaemolyticus]OCP68407.1 hypothetical protein AKH08_16480 [Vibrio parahaemolyticus]
MKGSTSSGNNKLKNQAKKVNQAVEKNLSDKVLFLEPGVVEFALRSQAKSIKLLKRINVALFTALFVSLLIIWFKQDPELPKPTYFASDSNGGVKPLTPLNEPITNTTAMRDWTEECILKALDLTFMKPISKVNEVIQECFSSDGQVGYVQWLLGGKSSQQVTIQNGTSRSIDIPSDSEYAQIVMQKLTMSASKIAPARMKSITPAVIQGESIARWDLELPVVVQKFTGVEGKGAAKYTVKVTLKRTTNQAREAGVDIDSWSIIRG